MAVAGNRPRHPAKPVEWIIRSAGNVKIRIAASIVGCLLCVLAIQGCVGVVATGTAAGAVTAQERRSPGTLIDDELIEHKVLAAIRENEALSRSRIHVNATSFNGLVLLTGEAPDEALRTRITEIARIIPGIRGIHNEVAVEAPSTLITRMGDAVVTGKVKAALFGDMGLVATRVKVVTEKGVVYLMGLLKQDEADRITDVTRRVAGVQRVVKVMEYIE